MNSQLEIFSPAKSDNSNGTKLSTWFTTGKLGQYFRSIRGNCEMERRRAFQNVTLTFSENTPSVIQTEPDIRHPLIFDWIQQS